MFRLLKKGKTSPVEPGNYGDYCGNRLVMKLVQCSHDHQRLGYHKLSQKLRIKFFLLVGRYKIPIYVYLYLSFRNAEFRVTRCVVFHNHGLNLVGSPFAFV